MARAGRVAGIHPKRSLRENAILVVETRLAELLAWRGALEDPSRLVELHDMRIAAKRLRYALEIFEVCFPEARPVLQDLGDIQEDLGAIHDLDVLADILRRRLALHDVQLEQRATEIAATSATVGERSNRLRAMLYAQARDRQRLGLLGLLGERIAERRGRYQTFQQRWRERGLDDFASRVRALLESSRPPEEADHAPEETRRSAVAQ